HPNQPAPLGQVVVLFPTGYGDSKSLCYFCSPFQFPVGTGLLKMTNVMFFEQSFSNFDRFRRRKSAVRIHQEVDVISHGFSHCRQEALGSPWSCIPVMSVDLTDTDLKGSEPLRVSQPY